VKRTPLRRKTPLKRSGRLRPMSKDKAAWNRLYVEEKRKRYEAQTADHGFNFCEHCNKPTQSLDPHHTQSRRNENILVFMLICRTCHDWIHAHPNAARELGLLK